MGIFTGSGGWVPSQVPTQIRVKLDDGSKTIFTYEQDYVYHDGWFHSFAGLLSSTAYEDAHYRAAIIREQGYKVDDRHIPVHRIREIHVVKCKWVEVEEEITVKKWEAVPA